MYQTGHTAAVLHLAAGENPLFVSRLLGHSSTKMLFERYAPFVANALADDGSRFERMITGIADGKESPGRSNGDDHLEPAASGGPPGGQTVTGA